jgi:hypothetical protein
VEQKYEERTDNKGSINGIVRARAGRETESGTEI